MQPEKKGTMIKDALTLFVITLIAAILLGFVYEITKEPIAEQEQRTKNEAYAAVFDGLAETKQDAALDEKVALSEELIASNGIDKVSVEEALLALDASGNVLGYVMTVSSRNGYGGEIEFAMGYSFDGTMMGISFLTLAETPGLGMNAKEEKFTSQFFDIQTSSFGLAKSGIAGETEVDAISSATVTTRAVTLGVNGGLLFAADAINAGIGGATR